MPKNSHETHAKKKKIERLREELKKEILYIDYNF
jgi:protein-arginine kinase activator protein McsA